MMSSKYMNLVKILILIWNVSIASKFFTNTIIKLSMKKIVKIKIKIKRRVNKNNYKNMK